MTPESNPKHENHPQIKKKTKTKNFFQKTKIQEKNFFKKSLFQKIFFKRPEIQNNQIPKKFKKN